MYSTVWSAHTFIAFLQSDDPAAVMPPDRRESLLARARQAADTGYMEDQWPQVGTGLQQFPPDRPLPAFTLHHYEQALQQTGILAGVAKECNAMAKAKLESFLEPVRNELIDVETSLGMLPGTYRLPARDETARLVRRLDEWRTAHHGTDCRIASKVDSLTTPRKPVSLRQTREAVDALMRLRRGYDGNLTDLSAEKQPAFRARWDRLFALLEQDDLAAFQRELEEMKQLRTELLSPTLQSFYSPMPAEDLPSGLLGPGDTPE